MNPELNSRDHKINIKRPEKEKKNSGLTKDIKARELRFFYLNGELGLHVHISGHGRLKNITFCEYELKFYNFH